MSTAESGETTVGSLISSTDTSTTSESGTQTTSLEAGVTTTEITTSSGMESTTSDFTGSTQSTTEHSAGSESTTQSSLLTSEFTGTTQSAMEYSVSGEFTGSTESSTEFTGSTISTTEFTGSTESAGTTVSDLWDSSITTTSSITDIFTKKPRMCKRKKKKKGCHTSKHGCCPDKITPAKGPFDEGCPIPETCKESKFGCCDDGVSPALGKNKEGCPQSHCNETLFGCCPDNKTPAEGNDNEGCPPPPPACLKSKYGCCPDNVTEAQGANMKGCEETTTPKPKEDCANSTFGCCPDNETEAKGIDFEGCDIFRPNCSESYFKCCPDGTSSAKGPNFKGCEMPCSNSTFGCCPDGRTPAHGRRGEGCCLVYEHGCCPDNITPARGPQLEGCSCEYSTYGCCPDNQTLARGPNKEGCNCRHSDHGCCPDDVTPAQGPQYQGCPCRTFQFGCCPDGVTAATGSHQQGCGCRNTEFGCCSDDVTSAKGPGRAGCDCSASRYGCCLDGVTDARGENYEGCEEIPINAQESCRLEKERGSCSNYSVKWYFDKDYGGCSRFWYGGCDGNTNRFKSKEECDSICVKPEGRDRCKLPKISGPCEGYYVQWYYDDEKKTCEQFVYSGCLGNNNKFETANECNLLCSADNSVDPCEQPTDQGPCRGNFLRWSFDKESRSCKQFQYGGCKGNSNNFATEGECSQKCMKSTSKQEKDICHLPAETGDCANYTDRFYYDTRDRICRHFYYGGCGGNENSFYTEKQCQDRCLNQILEPITDAPITAAPQGPFSIDYCMDPSETGPCRAAMPRFFYDKTDGVCKNFIYGGCAGNRNNFQSVDDCYRYCGNAQDLCTLPAVKGDCQGEYPQYYYDQTTDTCKEFTYGGCGGNYNRFPDRLRCEQRCRRSPPIVATEPPPRTQRPPVPRPSEAMCLEQPDPGNCTGSQPVFFFDPNSGRCTTFSYTGCGGNNNRFNSEEQCERLCGQFAGQRVCEQEKDPGPCRYNYPKYYYDRETRRCLQFTYGGCEGNGNRFSSSRECEAVCLTRSEKPTNETDPAQAPTPSGPQPCQSEFKQCETLRCSYGIEAYVDENNCNNCRCHDPCRKVECPYDTKCAIDFNRNRTSAEDPTFVAVCRQTHKEGQCPELGDTNCERECYDDADCTLDLKCCRTSCGSVCALPVVREPSPLVTKPVPGQTESPYYPAELNNEEYKPEVTGEIGSHITLRCAVRGNPTPRISWSKDGIRIDNTRSRYRIKLDQSLQIITLYTTDSGIYLCTADNNLGNPIESQIRLDVVAPATNRSATILSDEEISPDVVVSLNAPAVLNCYALGFPIPVIAWWKDDNMMPLKTTQFEVRKDFSLLIHSVQLSNLGIYTCQAYNGIGRAASYSVTVQANGPFYGQLSAKNEKYLKYIINPPNYVPTYKPPYVATTHTSPPTTVQQTESTPAPVVENTVEPGKIISYIVPIKVNLTTTQKRFPVRSDLKLVCEFQGYPPPQIRWYKDGVPLASSDRINIEVHPTGSTNLVIYKATKADSGIYECEARNAYSSGTSSTTIRVEGMYVHPSCVDNPFFANCSLIVQSKYCNHKYYAKFCCKSCTEAGLLPVDGVHLLDLTKKTALRSNLV